MTRRPIAFISLCLGALLALAPAPLAAQGLSLSGASNGSPRDLFSQKSRLLDGRLAQQYAGSARLRPDAIVATPDGPIPAYRGAYRGAYVELAKDLARKHGVPENLFLRLVQQESGWNPAALSPKGARGLAQLMPETAALLQVNAQDPAQNLEGGARYLKMMHERFGSWRLALAAYNAGPEAVETHGGIPPYAETQDYVLAILGG